MNLPTPVPESAYVHIPFCRHRCAYCNFAVVADRLDLETAYLEALETELGWLETPRRIATLYVGGGTPTELTDAGLERLCRLLDKWFPRNDLHYEYTFEANPEGLTESRLQRLVAFGVNRLSLGVQSFNADKLQRLDRLHTAEQSHQAIELAKAHFENVAADLMFAAPGETLDTWLTDLATMIYHAPTHVSTYGLTIEAGTRFFAARKKGALVEIDEGPQRDMYLAAIDQLNAAGFEHYEVSNFARASQSDTARSRHNETYWHGRPYFAAGAGAARYVDGHRETNHRSTTAYIKRVLAGESPVAETEELSKEERARERLVFGLRRLAGVDLAAFAVETGFAVESLVGEKLPFWVEQGWLEMKDGTLRLTREGLLLSDSLWPEFL